MSEENTKLAGPDFAEGVPIADLAEGGMILGQVSGEAVLLARSGGALFAVGAECTHYHGPLAEGALVADTVRCPWHHACFSLRTGEAVRAPALSPVACWRVEEHDGRIYVREKLEPCLRCWPACLRLPIASMTMCRFCWRSSYRFWIHIPT